MTMSFYLTCNVGLANMNINVFCNENFGLTCEYLPEKFSKFQIMKLPSIIIAEIEYWKVSEIESNLKSSVQRILFLWNIIDDCDEIIANQCSQIRLSLYFSITPAAYTKESINLFFLLFKVLKRFCSGATLIKMQKRISWVNIAFNSEWIKVIRHIADGYAREQKLLL